MKINLSQLSLILMTSLVSLTGCGSKSEYVAPSIILSADMKNISVRAFENESSQPGINNKLWLATTNEFIRDGRVSYVDNEEKADGVVVGTIKQYIETELSHDQNLVATEYQLWVVINLKFLDRKKNQYLWEEPALEQKFRYFTETQPGGLTTEEAREQLWERFAKDIARRTIDGFGSVTSASPKAIPNPEPVKDNPAPDYPSTVPF